MSPSAPARVPGGWRGHGNDQKLREHLIATATRLISERGTAGLTVRDIAREAQVADGALYNHFADKEALMAIALANHVNAVMTAAGPLPEPGTGSVSGNLAVHIARGLAILTRILPAFAGLLPEPHTIVRFAELQASGGGAESLPDSLAAYLHAEQALGRIDPSASVEATTALLIGACHEQVLPRLLFAGPAAEVTIPPGFAEALAETILRGVAPAGPTGTGEPR